MRCIRALWIGVFISTLCVSGALFTNRSGAHAQELAANVSAEVDRIRDEIAERNARLQQIEKEIAQYQNELQKVGAEKSSLQQAIRQLELERQKVQADLSYTQNRIGATDLEIQKILVEIEETEADIERNKAAISQTLRQVAEADDTSIIETVLQHENISDFWTALEELEQLRSTMTEEVHNLSELNTILDQKLTENHVKREDLVALRNQYAGQREVLEVNKSEKNQLLAQTENKEENYQALLAEKKAAKEQFEREMREFEAQLQFILDPTTIPGAGTAVFRWPLDSVFVTQYFGNTSFAQSGGYNGSGHNGIDFRAARGTTVRAALSGEVIAVNEQVATMCQYGKWVLIRHANGLTTLYAHLSVVSVGTGSQVKTGDIIGYSGDTGYATGPHLHFTVYASEAVTFKQYTCNSGITLTIPISAHSGYLNPMSYLPAL